MKQYAFLTFFVLSILGGIHSLMTYSGKAGAQTPAEGHWPASSKLSSSKNPHLVMFLHPGCSCSKASLAELGRLLAEAPELSAQLVFMRTPKLEKLFVENPLISKAKTLPRTEIVFDEHGEEAKIFGAETSGHSYFYNEKSELIFNGGLTMARGHEGASVGKESILSYFKGKKSTQNTLVFGCDIFGKLKTLSMVGKYVD